MLIIILLDVQTNTILQYRKTCGAFMIGTPGPTALQLPQHPAHSAPTISTLLITTKAIPQDVIIPHTTSTTHVKRILEQLSHFPLRRYITPSHHGMNHLFGRLRLRLRLLFAVPNRTCSASPHVLETITCRHSARMSFVPKTSVEGRW